MAGVDTSTLDGLLKRVYTNKKIENLQNMEVATFTELQKSDRKPGGEGFFGPAHVQGNQRGQGSQNENERLRESGTQVVKQWKINPKVFTHTIRFSGLSLEIAKGNEESFADNLTFHTDNGVKDSTKELNAQCYRDGRGIIALVNGAVAASTTVVFDNGVPTHFRVGTYVDMINGGGVKQVDSVQIMDVDISAQTITMETPVTVDDNARIYRENVGDFAPADGKELAGYPLVGDDGTILATFENILRNGAGSVPLWRGFKLDAGGANVSNDFLSRMRFRMKVLSGTNVKRLRSNTSQMRKYLDLTIPTIRRKQGEKMDAMGGEALDVEVPTWNGLEWIMDTDIAFDQIIMEDSDYFMKYEVKALSLDDTDSGKVLKWDNGFDGFICYLKEYSNTGTENPRKGITATNLNTPTF